MGHMVRGTAIRGWTAALAAALLATVAAVALVATAGAQSASGLTVGSATVAPGTTGIVIPVTVDATDVGSYRVDVQYDASLVTATACESTFGVCSVDTVAANTVRINGTNLQGIDGDDVVLGTITFDAGDDEGVAALTLDDSTILFSDTEGGTLDVSGTDGAITITTITPSPTAAPTSPGTAAPTSPGATAAPTAAQLPSTGGPGDDSSSTLTWLLALTGLVVVAGGAWAVARARRVS
jgi:hypothetical protein